VEKKPSDESLDEELQKSVYELSARYCHMDGYEPLDVPAPPPVEEKPKSKRKSKKAKEETQIEDKGEEKKDGEEEKGLLYNKTCPGLSLNFMWTGQVEKVGGQYFLGVSGGFLTFSIFSKKKI